MNPYLKPVNKAFKQHADPAKATGAKAYMRNQFEFFGIQTPVRRQISKEIFQAGLPEIEALPIIIRDAWAQSEREFQYFAIELAGAMKNQWLPDMIPLIEKMITQKSWWDSVDHIASWILGPYFQKYPNQIKDVTYKWNQSDNFWLQRSSIMFQKSYRSKTDTKLLTDYILHCAGSKEFFIQKAIGWALREYAKTNPDWVKKFVKTNELPVLSRREALKHFN
jgi:3-methyladenine DNA glycosylase AlkD